MEFLMWALWGVMALLGGIALNMLASEAYDWCGKWAERIIRFGVMRLPEGQRSRYEEEWLAHMGECPGKISKLVHACGTLRSSWLMRSRPTGITTGQAYANFLVIMVLCASV